MFIPNRRAVKYVQQELRRVKGEINKSTIIIEDTNAPLSTIHRTTGEQTGKDTGELSNSINQKGLNNIYKTLHSTETRHTFGWSANGTYTKKDHILGRKN